MHDEYRFLIDCGEGTQRQIMQSGIGFKRLNRVLITHGHLDHILGLAGLMSTFSRWEAIDFLEIYGGAWALERIHDLIHGVVLRGARPGLRLELKEVHPGPVFSGEDFTVNAFPVYHRGPDCFAYQFVEHARRPFLPERAADLEIPPGRGGAIWSMARRCACRMGARFSPTRCSGRSAPACVWCTSETWAARKTSWNMPAMRTRW